MDMFTELRRRGVPLVAVSTADQPYTTARIAKLCSDVPCVVWDAVRGPYGANELNLAACAEIIGKDSPAMYTDAPAALDVAMGLPNQTVLMMQGAHRLISDGQSAPSPRRRA